MIAPTSEVVAVLREHFDLAPAPIDPSVHLAVFDLRTHDVHFATWAEVTATVARYGDAARVLSTAWSFRPRTHALVVVLFDDVKVGIAAVRVLSTIALKAS